MCVFWMLVAKCAINVVMTVGDDDDDDGCMARMVAAADSDNAYTSNTSVIFHESYSLSQIYCKSCTSLTENYLHYALYFRK